MGRGTLVLDWASWTGTLDRGPWGGVDVSMATSPEGTDQYSLVYNVTSSPRLLRPRDENTSRRTGTRGIEEDGNLNRTVYKVVSSAPVLRTQRSGSRRPTDSHNFSSSRKHTRSGTKMEHRRTSNKRWTEDLTREIFVQSTTVRRRVWDVNKGESHFGFCRSVLAPDTHWKGREQIEKSKTKVINK